MFESCVGKGWTVVALYFVSFAELELCVPEFSFLYDFGLGLATRDTVEKSMAPRSSTLAWKIPWMEEPGRLLTMGSLKVRND